MSESDVYRRHVLTSKVGPRVERVIVEKVVILEAVLRVLERHYENTYMVNL